MNKKYFFVIIIFTFLFVSASSADINVPVKDETVYIKLSGNGAANGVYVVNSFESGGSSIIDYGDYETIKPLSAKTTIEQSGDKITLNTEDPSARQYYQGELKNYELPVEFLIKYYLDDKETVPLDMLSKSGHIKITIDVTRNDKSSAAFKSFMLQLQATLSEQYCSNIKADGATIVSAGGVKTIVFTLLTENKKQFVIEADANNFQMDAISANLVKNSMDISSILGSFGNINLLINGLDTLIASTEAIQAKITALEGKLDNALYLDLKKDTDTLVSTQKALFGGIGAMIGGLGSPEGNLSSFVSNKNTVNSVQFIFRSIDIVREKEVIVHNSQPENKNIWQKISALFE